MKPLHLLVLVTTVNHIMYVGSRLTVLLYAVQLGASPATVGVLTALFSVLGITTSVATGRWIDRVGPRNPMLWTALLMAAGGALPFVWDHMAALFILALTVGTAYNIYFTGQQIQIGRYGEAADRVGNFAFYMQAFSVASFIAPLITGFAIDEVGYAWTFLIFSAFPLVPALVIALDKLDLSKPATSDSENAGTGKKKKGSVWDLMRLPDLRRIFIAALLIHIGWNLYTFVTPIYGTSIHLSASQIGIILSTFSLASVVVRAAAPALSRLISPWQVMILALLVTALGLIASPFFTSVTALMALAFWLGLGLGVGAPVSMALMYEASPPDRIGEVLGLRLSLINAMQTVVPLTAGAIGAALGVGPVFWTLAALMVIGAWAARRQWRAP